LINFELFTVPQILLDYQYQFLRHYPKTKDVELNIRKSVVKFAKTLVYFVQTIAAICKMVFQRLTALLARFAVTIKCSVNVLFIAWPRNFPHCVSPVSLPKLTYSISCYARFLLVGLKSSLHVHVHVENVFCISQVEK